MSDEHALTNFVVDELVRNNLQRVHLYFTAFVAGVELCYK